MPVRTLEQMRNVPVPPWVWEGFIAPKSFTLFSAYPKVGKTSMIARMLKHMMLGDPFLDRQTRRVPTLYISEEADTLLAQRCVGLGYSDDWPIGWLTPEPGLTWEKCILYMKRWIHVHREPLIIVDTLSRFWSAADENNATQVDHALRPVLEVIRNSEASFMAIHHNRKQGGGGGMGVRGSTALTGGVDVIMELVRLSPYDHSTVRRLQCESRYAETPNMLQIRMEDDTYFVEDADVLDLEPTIISILQTMEDVPLTDLQYLTGAAESTLRRAITSLTNRGMIVRNGRGTSGAPFTYRLALEQN